MHYGSDFFAKKSGVDTIIPKLRGIKKDELGRQYFSHYTFALSDQDVIQTNLMYRCNVFNGIYFPIFFIYLIKDHLLRFLPSIFLSCFITSKRIFFICHCLFVQPTPATLGISLIKDLCTTY